MKIVIENTTDAFKFLKETKDDEFDKFCVKELLEVAKFIHVVGRHNMKKAEIIEKLIEMKHKREGREEFAEKKLNSGKDVIVAVRLNSGKLTTAKILKILSVKGTEKDKVFKLETATKMVIKVSGERIEWYKFKGFFPSFIYNELKEKKREYEEKGAESPVPPVEVELSGLM